MHRGILFFDRIAKLPEHWRAPQAFSVSLARACRPPQAPRLVGACGNVTQPHRPGSIARWGQMERQALDDRICGRWPANCAHHRSRAPARHAHRSRGCFRNNSTWLDAAQHAARRAAYIEMENRWEVDDEQDSDGRLFLAQVCQVPADFRSAPVVSPCQG